MTPNHSESEKTIARIWDGMRGRDLLTLDELDGNEIMGVVGEALLMKSVKQLGLAAPQTMHGRHVALLFMRSSFRTRCAFSIATLDRGGHPHLLDPLEIRFGVKESLRDIARVTSRMFDLLVVRCDQTSMLHDLSSHLDIPVWNAMTDQDHPTQVIADIMTMVESGIDPAASKIAFLGHGNGNVCRSLMKIATKVGMTISIVTPPGFEPDQQYIDALLSAEAKPHPNSKIQATTSLEAGLPGAHAIYADVWSNTDHPEPDIEAEVIPFQPYRVTPALMRMTGLEKTIFLHCMPSFHSLNTEYAKQHPTSLDTDDDVFEGPQSRAIDQAENRLHVVKALLKNAF